MNCHPYIHITYISYHFYHEFTLSMQQNHSPLGYATEKKELLTEIFHSPEVSEKIKTNKNFSDGS